MIIVIEGGDCVYYYKVNALYAERVECLKLQKIKKNNYQEKREGYLLTGARSECVPKPICEFITGYKTV